jgi:hypothetical protein
MTTPAGFLTVFPGWNVWDLYQANEPDVGLLETMLLAGLSRDRQLQIWVENNIKDNAPGAAVADPLNPAALRGDQIQIIPKVTGLKIDAGRENAGLGGSQHIGDKDAKGDAELRTVRFFNRGVQAVMPWPHDTNYLVDVAYTPSTSNPVTNAEAPSSLASGLTKTGDALMTGAKIAGVGIGLLLILQLTRKS